MTPDFVSQLATNWGPMGLLVGYLIYKDWSERKARLEMDKARLEYDKARLEADKAMSGALASLTTAILKGEKHD